MKELRNYLKESFSKRALLDSNVVAEYLSGNSRAKAFFEEHVFSGEMTPVVSPRVIAELYAFCRNKREEAALSRWLSAAFDFADDNFEVASLAGKIKRDSKLSVPNAMIASSAIVYKIPLVTTEPSVYTATGVKTFKPWP